MTYPAPFIKCQSGHFRHAKTNDDIKIDFKKIIGDRRKALTKALSS